MANLKTCSTVFCRRRQSWWYFWSLYQKQPKAKNFILEYLINNSVSQLFDLFPHHFTVLSTTNTHTHDMNTSALQKNRCYNAR